MLERLFKFDVQIINKSYDLTEKNLSRSFSSQRAVFRGMGRGSLVIIVRGIFFLFGGGAFSLTLVFTEILVLLMI